MKQVIMNETVAVLVGRFTPWSWGFQKWGTDWWIDIGPVSVHVMFGRHR